ncbi:MAG: transposase [Chloroflexi bacterium]|nr:transposase [Chloroflexota bacterium]
MYPDDIFTEFSPPKPGDFGVRQARKQKMYPGDIFKTAKNNPPHLFRANALYMLTASTYQKQPFMKAGKRKMEWINAFSKSAEIHQWKVVAWVVLDNHYHAIVRSPEQKLNMPKFVASYHKFTARRWNQEDQIPGRKVWWNYWDTCIRSEKDYLARLRYIFLNPVKHGIVDQAEAYPFSNYKAFLSVETWPGLVPDGELNDVPDF